MNYLFYITHPAKFQLYKYTIKELKKNNEVDIIINSKGVLEHLIDDEGWKYVNLYPKGRNKSLRSNPIKQAIQIVITVLKLELYLIKSKKYDKFITNDALAINGWLRRIPTYIFNDNDISTIKYNKILFYFADKIIAPDSTDLGNFNSKGVFFKGNKALGHLHPKYYSPNENNINKYGLKKNEYIIIRLAILNATHDIMGNQGITNSSLDKIIKIFEKEYQIIIVSERILDDKYVNYLYKGNPSELSDFIKFAKILISDSGSITTEAAMLGTPNILINRIAPFIGVHKELEAAGIQKYYAQFDEGIIREITRMLSDINLNITWEKNRDQYLSKCDDLNKILIDLIQDSIA